MEEHPISPHRAVLFLAALAGLFAVAQFVGLVLEFGFGHSYIFGLRPLFDLDREHNFPSLFSAMLLLISSGLLVLEALAHSGWRRAAPWWGLALLFLLAAADEALALHERLILPLQALLDASGYFFFAWVIPYGAVVLVLGVIYLQFFRALPPPVRFRFFAAAALYLGGAVGLEMIGAGYYERIAGIPDLRYSLLVTVEELLEMGGALVFIHTVLTHLAGLGLRVRFAAEPSADRFTDETSATPATLQQGNG